MLAEAFMDPTKYNAGIQYGLAPIIYIVTCVALGTTAVFLVLAVEPAASGSGTADLVCYLNGVKVPKFVRLKTWVIKLIGCVLSCTASTACGPEGPILQVRALERFCS